MAVNYTYKIYTDPVFVTSAIDIKGYPILRSSSGKILPEVAVAGRSNVGKSSLLNHLFQRKDLVKTSSQPGKTQLLNFFTLGNEIGFVDLPGYGYAQVSPEVRKKWGPMIQKYLSSRKELKLILFLFDIRRMPNEEDMMFIEWVARRQLSMILVLTKVDKVTLNEKNLYTKKILSAFNSDLQYTHYSVTKNMGRKELIAMMNEALNEALTEEQQEEPLHE